MNRSIIIFILIILIIGTIAVLYLDLFNLQNQKEAVIAKIINYEDTRRTSDSFKELFNDPDPDIRERAALAVGRIGTRDYIEQLFKLLDDDSAKVAEAAAFAIGLCGNKEDAARLIDICDAFEPDLEAMAVQAVGRLADTTTIDIVNEIISRLDHVDHRVREQAAYAIFRSGYKDAWPKLVDICRSDPVRPVQVAALFALTRMRVAEPVDLYEEWYSDSDPYVRSLAYRGLALGKDEKLIPTIASGLNDRDNNVVSQAISSLASIGTKKAVEYIEKRYSDETDDKLRVQMLNAFTRLRDSSMVAEVTDDIHNPDFSNTAKAAGLHYLCEIEGEKVIALVDSMVTSDDFYLRGQIADCLREIGGVNVKPRLMSLFKDSSSYVRANAFEALVAVDSENVDYYINTALNDSNYIVNAYGVYKIGELKKQDFLPQLMTIFETSDRKETVGGKIGYDDAEIKRAVVEAIGNMLTKEPDSLMEEILFRCLHDDDYITSRNAAALYKDVLGVNKDAYISHPKTLVSVRDMKNALVKYKQNPQAVISTKKGDITLELFFDKAPMTVYNFIKLARKGYFDGLIFHRVVPNFVIQGGDPLGTGWGGPGYSIRCEYNELSYKRGMMGMAHAGKDTGGSQFFITLSPQPHLDGRYTLFGEVINGMSVVEDIDRGDTIQTIVIREYPGE